MNGQTELEALWKFMVVALIGGAGLTAMYALGLVGLSSAGARRRAGGRGAAGLLLAGVCFLTVTAAVGAWLYLMVSS